MTYTDEKLLAALQEFAANHEGRPPTAAEANDPEGELPVAQTFINHFGSWNAAVTEAGYAPRDRRRSDAELLADLRDLTAEHGEYPTTTTVADHEEMAHPEAYRRRFGSWIDALAAAGLAE